MGNPQTQNIKKPLSPMAKLLLTITGLFAIPSVIGFIPGMVTITVTWFCVVGGLFLVLLILLITSIVKTLKKEPFIFTPGQIVLAFLFMLLIGFGSCLVNLQAGALNNI